MIWDPVERLLWGIAIALLLFGGIIYFVNGKKRENHQDRDVEKDAIDSDAEEEKHFG